MQPALTMIMQVIDQSIDAEHLKIVVVEMRTSLNAAISAYNDIKDQQSLALEENESEDESDLVFDDLE